MPGHAAFATEQPEYQIALPAPMIEAVDADEDEPEDPAPPPPPARTRTIHDPLEPTSLHATRYGLAEVTVRTEDAQGQPLVLSATLSDMGTPTLSAGLVTHLDRGSARPAVRAYLDGRQVENDAALAPLLPLTLEEARQLLRLRHPKLSTAVERCLFGGQSARSVGDACRPPVAQQTISDRKWQGIRHLERWTVALAQIADE